MSFDLTSAYADAVYAYRDYHSGLISDKGLEAAEIEVLETMCAYFGLPSPEPGAWAADNDVMEWLNSNRKDYILYCLSEAGVYTDGVLWMQSAGTLRHLGKL